MPYSLYLSASVEIAQKAGQYLKSQFFQKHTLESKSHVNDIVTECDKTSEEMIKSYLKTAFPNTSFLCEESKFDGPKEQDTWIIDPLDGTVNFANQIPFFAVSIALFVKNQIQCAVIYSPMTSELFTAIKGQGAFLNDKKIHVSSKSDLLKSFGATGFPYLVQNDVQKTLKPIENMLKKGVPLRRLGSACLDMAYLACGRFDVFFESFLEPWDFAAARLLIEEAGGKITDFENNKLPFFSPSSVVASNGVLQQSLLKEMF
jgi:myo-inositol-1(or 4)-monophosphatase